MAAEFSFAPKSTKKINMACHKHVILFQTSFIKKPMIYMENLKVPIISGFNKKDDVKEAQIGLKISQLLSSNRLGVKSAPLN